MIEMRPLRKSASTAQLRREAARLRRLLRSKTIECRILRGANAVIDSNPTAKYNWIRAHRSTFSVTRACRVLRVSASGYFGWLARRPGVRAERHTRIVAAVRTVHDRSHGIYGSAKIAAALDRQEELEKACRNTVSRAMRELGIAGRPARKCKSIDRPTSSNPAPAPNRLARRFSARMPNRKWVTDITYLPVAIDFGYLAVVLDLFSRRVVGWKLGDSLETNLVIDALSLALAHRRPDGSQLLLHSDRGCQYTSAKYRDMLRRFGIACSMSRAGCCQDNAAMERFFWSLKHEWTNLETYRNLASASQSVSQYIDSFYNPVRLHQTLGYLSPDEFEARYASINAAKRELGSSPQLLG